MMNLNQAIAYGNQMGVKFYVRNSNGGLMGGTKTREQAQAMKKEFRSTRTGKNKILSIRDASIGAGRNWKE